MAANLLGGFAKCLKESKDRIKKHLVTIFNIGTEINTIMGNYASAIAYIFEAFAGENGQKLTANIIGIFANAFMGIIELYGKFGRDIINIITIWNFTNIVKPILAHTSMAEHIITNLICKIRL